MNIMNEITVFVLNVAIKSLDTVLWKFLLRALGETSLAPRCEVHPRLEHCATTDKDSRKAGRRIYVCRAFLASKSSRFWTAFLSSFLDLNLGSRGN